MKRQQEKLKKQEVAEKVKEIKQRQQNWMKQRAQDGHSQRNGQPKKDTSKTQPTQKTAVQKVESHRHVPENYRDKREGADTKPREKFQNWLKARNTAGKEVEYSSDDVHNQAETADAEVNVLRVDSARSAQYATPEPGWLAAQNAAARQPVDRHLSNEHPLFGSTANQSIFNSGSVSVSDLLTPRDFNSIADTIIAKVREDLHIRNPSSSVEKMYISDKYKSSHERNGDFVMNKEPEFRTGLTSHQCIECGKLMYPKEYSPVLLIPCGHTLCRSCATRCQYCPICGNHVTSSTANIMLEQIIKEYHARASIQSERTERGKFSQANGGKFRHSDNFGDPEGNGYNKSDYREDYQTLLTRESVLKEEAENTTKNIHKLSLKLKCEQQQIKNIENEEQKARQQIKSLQEKLASLKEHRVEFEATCRDLDWQSKEEEKRLVLIKSTMKTLRAEAEKIQLFLEADD